MKGQKEEIKKETKRKILVQLVGKETQERSGRLTYRKLGKMNCCLTKRGDVREEKCKPTGKIPSRQHTISCQPKFTRFKIVSRSGFSKKNI